MQNVYANFDVSDESWRDRLSTVPERSPRSTVLPSRESSAVGLCGCGRDSWRRRVAPRPVVALRFPNICSDGRPVVEVDVEVWCSCSASTRG